MGFTPYVHSVRGMCLNWHCLIAQVLYDHSVSKSQSIMRASGLKRLGTIFQEVKGSGVHSPVEATMMRAMGADLNYLYS